MKRAILAFAAALALGRPLPADDWPMWGGRPDRNMVSPEKGLPLTWELDEKKGLKKNIKWVAPLGKMTYGSPVVSGGRVYIGSSIDTGRDADGKGYKGVLKCLSEADGSLLWQAVHDKLAEDEDNNAGVCSVACVSGDRVYYVSNRGELVCADALGFSDKENDGPFKDEKPAGERDADIVWLLDMRKKLGIQINQGSSSSPLVVGDLVFVVTGQGADYKTRKVKNPKAPSFIAVNRATGEVVWQDASPAGHILWGQWGSPAYGEVEGKPQVAFPGGDGWLYAFEPATGKPLWKFNGKAHEKPNPKGEHENENQLVATPVYVGHRVLIAVGDPESAISDGSLRAIDARQRGDITKTGELWRASGEKVKSSISTVAVHQDLVFHADRYGNMNCHELSTGALAWNKDLLSEIWGAPLVADGKVYVQTGDGEVKVLQAGREYKELGTNKGLSDLQHGTLVAANGVLYVTGSTRLYAVAAGK